MKRFFIALLAIFSIGIAQAQFNSENDIEVQGVLSPKNNRTYNTIDTFDIIIRVINNGPNPLIAGDELKVSYSVGDGNPGSFFADTLIQVGSNTTMQVGQGRTYTIHKDFIINGNNTFSACASVTGTVIYPINTNKSPEDCEQFIVSIPEQEISIQKTYYSRGEVRVKLDQSLAQEVKIYDLTGKLLYTESNINSDNVTIPFAKKVKGFYFVNVSDNKGNQATSKFVVN